MPPEPIILAFDTSAAHCAAALLSGGRILVSRSEDMSKGQAERLFPLLEELLIGAGFGWRDLTALAVGTGPGNFTGVRISVAAARGLALSLAIPAHAVTMFEARAFGLPRPCLVAMDARQGRLYLQGFGTSDEAPLMVDSTALPDELAHPDLCVIGDASEAVAAALGARAVAPTMPIAEAMAYIAANRPTPSSRPAPLYLRAADAAPSRDAPPVILT